MTPTQIETAFSRAGLTGDWVAQDQGESLPADKGAYALVLVLKHAVELDFAAGVISSLPQGTYAYLGSARGPGGLRARLKRHFSSEKKIHWHVDRLTLKAGRMWAFPVIDGHECNLVQTLLQSPVFEVAAQGFGSSDCSRCASHLLALKQQVP